MIYPEFLHSDSIIGITAPSGGIAHKIDAYRQAVTVLGKTGASVIETPDIYVSGVRSGSAKNRAAELNSLFQDDRADFILSAAGGDFLFEILPEVDWELLRRHPKWLMGMSDPTGLLFPQTVNNDIATMYGMNAGSFAPGTRFRYVRNALSLMKGDLVVQKSYTGKDSRPAFSKDPLKLNTPSRWQSNDNGWTAEGRCIGGCIDVLKDLIGTPYGNPEKMLRQYASDGFIWYFDVFSMSAEAFYRTLLQMKYSGWFEQVKAVLLGRVLLPSSETGMTYEEALQRVFSHLPYCREADIGHTLPCMTMINGAIMRISFRDGKAELTFQLKK